MYEGQSITVRNERAARAIGCIVPGLFFGVLLLCLAVAGWNWVCGGNVP